MHVVGGKRGQVAVENLSLSLSDEIFHIINFGLWWSLVRGLQNSAKGVWREINKYCVGGKDGCLCGGIIGLIKFERN